MVHRYRCQRCHCYLDPSEMPICDECREEIRQEEEQRKHCIIPKGSWEEIMNPAGRGA